MDTVRAHTSQPDIGGVATVGDEPSVSSALERLGTAGSGVVAKRMDLAILDGQELLSRALGRAALIGPGIVLATVAWFAVAAAFVLLVAPAATLAVRLAIFGLLNAGGALALVALGARRGES